MNRAGMVVHSKRIILGCNSEFKARLVYRDGGDGGLGEGRRKKATQIKDRPWGQSQVKIEQAMFALWSSEPQFQIQ